MEGDGPSLLPIKFLRTIPQNLNSLIGTDISIKSDDPRDVIELLGQVLGITDYKSNTISFWFLDVLALQLLRYKEDLDDHSRSLLISWLSGEMILIRDKKLERENFFKQMENIFISAADRISAGGSLLYWDEFIARNIGDAVQINMEEQDFSKIKPSSLRKSLEQRLSKENDNLSAIPIEMSEPSGSTISSSIDLRRILNIIIDSTYDMYGSELRYALIHMIFVEQVELQTYHIPFLLRKPRPIKVPERDVHAHAADSRQQKSLINRTVSKESTDKRSGKKSKNKKKTRTSEVMSDIFAASSTPISDEELLKTKRSFILPLAEANEAEDVVKGDQDNTEKTDIEEN